MQNEDQFYAIILDSDVLDDEFWTCKVTSPDLDEIRLPQYVNADQPASLKFPKKDYNGRWCEQHNNVTQINLASKVGANIFFLERI